MAYLALYRKYRPSTFDTVTGQKTAVKILKNQIISDRVGHAYLFSGIRGTGKTSLAKIFARAINCEHPVDGNPCGVCRSCVELSKPVNMDIIEIDAASNRGVDEIRDLREKVKYPPTIGTYKVYIIDEVHMLTKEAFNALLKTLEEPPEHAVFILATTEPARLPETIRSRCQHYEIRPIADSLIEERMREICAEEGIKLDDESFKILAKRANHSMRDGLSLLDQASDLELSGVEISASEVRDLLGIAREEGIEEIVRFTAAKDAKGVMEALDRLRSEGASESLLVEDLIRFYRDLILIRSGGEDHPEKKGIADLFTLNELYLAVELLSETYQKMRYSQIGSVLTDLSLLKLTQEENPAVRTPVQEEKTAKVALSERGKETLEVKSVADKTAVETVPPTIENVQPDTPTPTLGAEKEIKSVKPVSKGPEGSGRPKAGMKQIKEQVLTLLDGMAKRVVEESEFQYAKGTFYLVLCRDTWKVTTRVVTGNEKKIREALCKVVGKKVGLIITTLEEFRKLAREQKKELSERTQEKKEQGTRTEEKSSSVQESSASYEVDAKTAQKSLEEIVRAAVPGDYAYSIE